MMDYRKAYGLPERYFLSLGRMVEKKNLSTLVEAYARFARASVEKHGAGSMEHGVGSMEHGEKKHGAGSMEQRANLTENCKLNTEHCPPGLVFVGSGELEDALREQARALGLRVIDRSDWKVNGREEAQEGDAGPGGVASPPQAENTGECSDVTGETPVPPGQAVDRSSETRDSLPATHDEENRGTVFFYGFRQIEENPVFYALAEAFVLPSLKEEWGLVVNEAMAAGLPVIVSRTAGCAEDLLPGSEGVQCSVLSVQSEENGDAENCKLTSEECDEQEADARAGRSVEHGAGGMESGENAGSDDCQLKTENSLEQRSNGFVFDPMSSDALSEALRRIADPLNPKRSTLNAAAMGRRSREIVAKFSCENFARQALRAAEAASA